MMRIIGSAALLAVATGLHAGPYDGTYVFRQPDKDTGRQCADQGFPNVWFTGDRYDINGELDCVFGNGVAVRDMPATLYDVTCGGLEPRGPFREMILETDWGLVLVRVTGVLELVKCE